MTNNTDLRTQNNATNSQRRTALKLAASSGLLSGAALTSGSWTKPAINAVLLPAHAQTSMMTVFSGSSGMVAKAPVLNRDSILDLFVTPVNAGNGNDEMSASIEAYAIQTGDDAFDFQFLITAAPRRCKDKTITEDAIFSFIEVSATEGTATIPNQQICNGITAVEGDFDYQTQGDDLMISLSISSEAFEFEDAELIMGPGGMPLTEPECTLCPINDED